MAVSNPRPNPEGSIRRSQSDSRRRAARNLAQNYPNPVTQFNQDEVDLEDDGYAMSFTKGLHHDENGILVNNAHYSSLTEAINQDAPTDFTQLERGISTSSGRPAKTRFSGDSLDKDGDSALWRGWESPRAGHYFSLEGPDADAVSMPPAPSLGSSELEAEMAEVYALALLRDVPFSQITSSSSEETPSAIVVDDVIDAMTSIDWYTNKTEAGLSLQERRRRAARFSSHADHDINEPPNNGVLERKDVFRGSGPGVKVGPYLSQFMVHGTRLQKETTDGAGIYSNASLSYGSQEIDQKVSFFPKAVDYMLHWNAYLDVQNGANFSDANKASPLPRRFINTPRDLATYVKLDQLYQAYLNACLFMLGKDGFKLQQPVMTGGIEGPGFPDRSPSDSRQGFATFGGPHVLSLVTEVATRCLKAVRRQKFNYHRRARPERLGALLTLDAGALTETVAQAALQQTTRDALGDMRTNLTPLLALVNAHNKSRRADTFDKGDRPKRADGVPNPVERRHADPHLQNDVQQLDPANWDDDKNLLLPMAFAEGSPMHPSYGAGHATVAGGCVTILKAFFHTTESDGTAVEWPEGLQVFQVENDGEKLADIRDDLTSGEKITISGELNKLAANISIGRNMAGVHFYTDYYESLRMGERVSMGILIEHMTQIDERMEMAFESFDGDYIRLTKTGGGTRVNVVIKDSQGCSVSRDEWWTRHHPDSSSIATPSVCPERISIPA